MMQRERKETGEGMLLSLNLVLLVDENKFEAGL